MIVYEVIKNHDGWCETELVKTLEEAKEICESWNCNTPYEAEYKECNLIEWLLDSLESPLQQLDGEWLEDNLRNVLGGE